MTFSLAELTSRAAIRIVGPDTLTFLQGLITNDVSSLSSSRSIYAALLTPQGKFLFDFIIFWKSEDDLLFDTDGGRAEELIKRLNIYKLRAKVDIQNLSHAYKLYAIFGLNPDQRRALLSTAPPRKGSAAESYIYADPRHESLGIRMILDAGTDPAALLGKWGLEGVETVNEAEYDNHRLQIGIPEGIKDIVPEKSFVLESDLEDLHGVDHRKGCYIGQEVTSRTKRKGEIRKRILPLTVTGPLPAPGTPVTAGEEQLGSILSGRDRRALALLRLDRLAADAVRGKPLTAGGSAVELEIPDWLSLPDALRSALKS